MIDCHVELHNVSKTFSWLIIYQPDERKTNPSPSQKFLFVLQSIYVVTRKSSLFSSLLILREIKKEPQFHVMPDTHKSQVLVRVTQLILINLPTCDTKKPSVALL